MRQIINRIKKDSRQTETLAEKKQEKEIEKSRGWKIDGQSRQMEVKRRQKEKREQRDEEDGE